MIWKFIISSATNYGKKIFWKKNYATSNVALPIKINQQLNTLNLTIYKLLLIKGTWFYQCEIDWLSKMGKYMIKSSTTIYYKQEFIIKINILSDLSQLMKIYNNLNDRILAYFLTLLLLTHQQQLFAYDKHKYY